MWNQPGHQAGVGDLYQVSCSGNQKNRRLDLFKLLVGHHGRVAEQGGELLVMEKMRKNMLPDKIISMSMLKKFRCRSQTEIFPHTESPDRKNQPIR